MGFCGTYLTNSFLYDDYDFVDTVMVSIKHVGLTVGLFVVVGIGLGLSGYIAVDFVQGQFVNEADGELAQSFGQLFVVLIAIQTAFVTFLLGSVVSTVTGLAHSRGLRSRSDAAISNGVGSLVGFPIMVIIAVVLITMPLGGSGGGGDGGSSAVDIGQLLGQILLIAIPTTVVGTVVGWVGHGFQPE